ncbi:MAG: hypothetical protein M1454_05305 [Candidatus Thermoplasmatota archaeon]|nr:hypothetical protein [Candidatus Thermoplasmatota archaeon]MCL5731240.1 hypothetical protein [Candidatus Thermoplasmatota archaeon]
MTCELIEKLTGIVKLSDEEINEITSAMDTYSEVLQELIEVHTKFSQAFERKMQLDTRYASLNYKLYETFMEVHKNAIIISALRTELGIRGKDLGEEANSKISRILRKYLVIDKFY